MLLIKLNYFIAAFSGAAKVRERRQALLAASAVGVGSLLTYEWSHLFTSDDKENRDSIIELEDQLEKLAHTDKDSILKINHDIVKIKKSNKHSRDVLKDNLCKLENQNMMNNQKLFVEETFTRTLETLNNLNFQLNTGHISKDSEIYKTAMKQCIALNDKD